MATLFHESPITTTEDAFATSAARRDVAIGQVTDVAELVRILVLAADHYRGAASKGMGVHVSEFTALGHVRHAGHLTPSDLAMRLRLTTPAVTALIDRLEQRGMVRRQPNPADRRSLLVTLTPAGVAAYNGAFAELTEVAGSALDGLAEVEVDAVRHFLRAVASSFLIRSDPAGEHVGVSQSRTLSISSPDEGGPSPAPFQ